MRFGLLATLAVAAAGFVEVPAVATDYTKLKRPEVVRALLVSPERRRQLRCVAFLSSDSPSAVRIDPRARNAFTAAVLQRFGVEVGSRSFAEREVARLKGRSAGEPDLATGAMPFGSGLLGASCLPYRDLLLDGREERREALLGPVPSAAIALPNATECLAAFEADRAERPPGNSLAADMIGYFAAALAEPGGAAERQLQKARAKYRAKPPTADDVEVLALSCFPAAASLSARP